MLSLAVISTADESVIFIHGQRLETEKWRADECRIKLHYLRPLTHAHAEGRASKRRGQYNNHGEQVTMRTLCTALAPGVCVPLCDGRAGVSKTKWCDESVL
eukprot:scaffold2462_cov120-Skeletonema_dohrnii-CCMP3373.AAC.9